MLAAGRKAFWSWRLDGLQRPQSASPYIPPSGGTLTASRRWIWRSALPKTTMWRSRTIMRMPMRLTFLSEMMPTTENSSPIPPSCRRTKWGHCRRHRYRQWHRLDRQCPLLSAAIRVRSAATELQVGKQRCGVEIVLISLLGHETIPIVTLAHF